MLSGRQIQIMTALVAHRSFALAAEALGVSQPSLTRSLKAIEKSLGVPLIDRRGVTPTIFGDIVLRHGEPVLTQLSELARELDLVRGLGGGELRVAAGPYPADISVVRAVSMLSARHPKLSVELRIENWTRVVADVHENRIDLGVADITEALRDHDLQTEPIRTSAARFFCAANHPLAQKKSVLLEDLLEFPWVGPSYPARIRAVLPKVDKPFGTFDASTDRFHPRVLIKTFAAAKDIVLSGQALGAAVAGQIDREIRDGVLVTLPVDAPWLSLNYGFIFKSGRMLSPAAKAFMEIVRTIERGNAA